jgi:hypothetical protein
VYSKHYGPAADFSAYEDVVATGPKNAWAFGGTDISGGNGTVQQPVAAHWNGSAWASFKLPSGPTNDFIIAASAPAANDIWAVTFGGWVLHWTGVAWSLTRPLPGAGELTGVTALSPTDVWVFGGSGFEAGLGTWHYNGTTWTQWTTGPAAGLEGASALSAKDIWAIGSDRQAPDTSVDHFNGVTWAPASTTGFPAGQWQLTGIHAYSDKNIWVTADTSVNNSPAPYFLHYDGAKWSKFPLPWKMVIGGDPAYDGQGGQWFIGFSATSPSSETNYLVHWSHARVFSRVKVGTGPVPGPQPLGLAFIPGTTSLWGVGFNEAKTAGGSAVIWAYGKV